MRLAATSTEARGRAGVAVALSDDACLAFRWRGQDGCVHDTGSPLPRVGELERLYRGVSLVASRSADRQTCGSGEDVAQALFERLCSSPETPALEHPGVRRWFTLAAQRSAIDIARSEARRRARERRYADPRCASMGQCLEERLIEQELAATVRAAVARLDDKKRQAIILAFFEGLSHQQVAAALNIPLGTAKSRIRTALADLSALLTLARS